MSQSARGHSLTSSLPVLWTGSEGALVHGSRLSTDSGTTPTISRHGPVSSLPDVGEETLANLKPTQARLEELNT